MSKKVDEMGRKSKASMTVDLQVDGQAVEVGISRIRDVAQAMLDSEVPTKRQRKALVDTAESLLALKKAVVDKIPNIVPNDCTNYSLARIHSAKS